MLPVLLGACVVDAMTSDMSVMRRLGALVVCSLVFAVEVTAAGSHATHQLPARSRGLLQAPMVLESISNPGQCLSLPGGSGAGEGTQLVLATCQGTPEQYFVPPQSGGTMYLAVGDPSWNKTLSVPRNTTFSGVAVVVSGPWTSGSGCGGPYVACRGPCCMPGSRKHEDVLSAQAARSSRQHVAVSASMVCQNEPWLQQGACT